MHMLYQDIPLDVVAESTCEVHDARCGRRGHVETDGHGVIDS